jgi:hypothetical protein
MHRLRDEEREVAISPEFRAILGAGLGLLAASGCTPVVEGNGQYREKTYDVSVFHGISVGYGVQASVAAGAAKQSVVLSGDANIVGQYLTVEVSNDILETRLIGADHIDPKVPVRLVVTVPSLDTVLARDASPVSVVNANTGDFHVSAAGKSSVTVGGQSTGIVYGDLSGGSRLDAKGFPAPSADVQLVEASSAEVQVAGYVTGKAEGASTVRVWGGGSCAVSLADTSVCTRVQ